MRTGNDYECNYIEIRARKGSHVDDVINNRKFKRLLTTLRSKMEFKGKDAKLNPENRFKQDVVIVVEYNIRRIGARRR